MGHMSYGKPRILAFQSHEKVVIGKYCSIAEGVTIMPGGDHRVDWVTTYPLRIMFKMDGANQDGHPSTKGDVIVGNDVWIASGVKILSGVKIGDGAVIGANALVSKDVEPYSIVGGAGGSGLFFSRLINRFSAVIESRLGAGGNFCPANLMPS